MSKLFSPYSLGSLELSNRIVIAPMCQYSAVDGLPTDWHMIHLGNLALSGAALLILEATAVVPEGRISPEDLGLWSDQHAKALEPVVAAIRRHSPIKLGVQLAHAGRKASSEVPWEGGGNIPLDQPRGWQTEAPSAVPHADGDTVPLALDAAGLARVKDAFVAAARRAHALGLDAIELHGAHGYLLHQFLSPHSNQRDDGYGGSLENRMRFVLRVTERVRATVPAELPLFVRISATDWVAGGWDIEQSVELARRLKDLGVDLIDVSTGGNLPTARIPVAKRYQVPCSRRIRDDAGIPTGTVGLITDAKEADDIVTGGDADLVLVGRELLREPYWALKAQHAFEEEPDWPVQYGYAVKRRAK